MIDSQIILSSQICINIRYPHTQGGTTSMRNLTSVDNLRSDELDTIRWNGETHAARRCIKFWIDSGQRRNTDQVALHINQRTTTVTWINWCICLDSIGNDSPILLVHIAPQRTDDTIGNGLRNTQRITDCQHILAYLQLRGITQRCHGQVRGRRIDFQYR